MIKTKKKNFFLVRRASPGWLIKCTIRFNTSFETISGIVFGKMSCFDEMILPKDIYSFDETSLHFRILTDKTLILKKEKYVG